MCFFGLYDGFNVFLIKLELKKELSQSEEVVLRIMNGLKVRAIENSNSVEVSFVSQTPDMASKIVNTAVSIYKQDRINIYRSSSALDFFLEQTNIIEKNLIESEHRLKEFKKKWNISSIEEQRAHLLELNANLMSEIGIAETESAELNGKVENIKGRLEEMELNPTDGEFFNSSQVIDSLKLRLIDLKLKRSDLFLKYFEDSPFLVSVDQDIRELEKAITKEEIKTSVSADIAAVKSRLDRLKRLFTDSNTKLNKINELYYELRKLERKVQQNEKLYRTYFEKTEEMRMLIAMDHAKITDINVISKAYPPILPMRTIKLLPQRIFCILMSIWAGIFLSITIIALQEMFDHSFKSSQDIEEYLDLPVLGTISEKQSLRNKNDKRWLRFMHGLKRH